MCEGGDERGRRGCGGQARTQCAPTAMGPVAFNSLSQGWDPRCLRIIGINSTSNRQLSASLSKKSELMPRALAYQEWKEGRARPTEAN